MTPDRFPFLDMPDPCNSPAASLWRFRGPVRRVMARRQLQASIPPQLIAVLPQRITQSRAPGASVCAEDCASWWRIYFHRKLTLAQPSTCASGQVQGKFTAKRHGRHPLASDASNQRMRNGGGRGGALRHQARPRGQQCPFREAQVPSTGEESSWRGLGGGSEE